MSYPVFDLNKITIYGEGVQPKKYQFGKYVLPRSMQPPKISIRKMRVFAEGSPVDPSGHFFFKY